MLLKIDFESDIPIYMQIKNAILQGIAKGDLSPGENLPSVRQLAEDIGINMHTVNKAYNLLKNDGFLTIDRRKGAIINDKISSPTEEYKVLLEENLKSTIAEAICKGVSEGEFLTTCNNIFNTYKEGTKK
ncbi:HTH-type transcriptional repressor YtrA [Clostridium liquoris]|uniref:HTH-type transcriptional repressor YtrA n=1 Tax=Clostridium liquoris TaxID=1289519 RepID=A0A2T0B8D4_9CLOT|nr:GntR family transcriptional regulator [Clostridium liquoris]PRR80150.1 HTH-type transcriptional repressor YtrA [Clostridium liquoris]